MTEKQRDIKERLNDYYSEVNIEKYDTMELVIILLNKISEKVQFEEYKIKEKVNDLLNNLTKSVI